MVRFWMVARFVFNMQSMVAHKTTTGSVLAAETEDMIEVEEEGHTHLVVGDQGQDRTHQGEGLDRQESGGHDQNPAHHDVDHLSKIAVVDLGLLHQEGAASLQNKMVLQQDVEDRLRLTSLLSVAT